MASVLPLTKNRLKPCPCEFALRIGKVVIVGMISHARVVRVALILLSLSDIPHVLWGRSVNHRACAQTSRSCAHGNSPRAEAPTYDKRLPQPNASLRPSGGTVQVFGGCDLAVSLIRSLSSSRTLQILNSHEQSSCRIITTP